MTKTFSQFKISVPATTANIGSSFDCLGLSLTLFNHTVFSTSTDSLEIQISGFGNGKIPTSSANHIYQAMKMVEDFSQSQLPSNINIFCENNIPISSGLGSSAAAALTGILAANKILNTNLTNRQIYLLGNQIEGHLDNFVAAHLGGLQLIITSSNDYVASPLPIDDWEILVITPHFDLSTQESRSILPSEISISTAIDAIGKSNLSVDALRTGNADKLILALSDTLHQPHRIPLIPGAKELINHFNTIGIPATLSGAGPSIIAFGNHTTPQFNDQINSIDQIFNAKKSPYSTNILKIDREGAGVTEI